MKLTIIVYLSVILICVCFRIAHGIKWLSLQHSHLLWNHNNNNNNGGGSGSGRGIRSGLKSPCTIARRRYGLARLQTKLCRRTLAAMPYVQAAAALAADTCKTVFAARRWNCSAIDAAPLLTPDLTRATREQAYVYAISSAALTYTMARACASGQLAQCACAVPPREPPLGKWKWGGCGDNIRWGAHFAKRFVDTVEKRNARRRGARDVLDMRTITATVNLHNNRIGRKVIAENLAVQCKCHGVSGSCSIKTCWRAIPDLRQIGERLLGRFTHAREVPRSFVEAPRSIGDQLIFLTKSPDYCTKDARLGSLGTTGRKCSVTSNGTDGCRQLCCGRGYRTVVEERIERCECKYYYCCYVKCQTCRSLTQRHECS